MSKLDPRIEAVRQQYDLRKDDFWELPQKKGSWCVKHAALEIVAAKAGIVFDMPQVLEAKGEAGIAAVCVRGTMGNRSMWSIGECNPKNNRNAYPWAMAEKRAVDRVILKLVGIHGLVYSEDEMPNDEPRTTDQRSEQGRREVDRLSKANAREPFAALLKSMRENTTRADLKAWWLDPDCKEARARLPEDWQRNLHEEFADYGNSLPEDQKEAA